MKRVAILCNQHTPTLDAIRARLRNYAVDYFDSIESFSGIYDLIVAVGFNPTTINNLNYSVLTSHFSLLPAFNTDEPVRDAIMAGVKVTGITIYYTKTNRIIAQYPIFINNGLHYDEILQQLSYVEQCFYPVVIEKLLNNEAFDSQTVMGTSKCGNCGGCNQCSTSI